MILREPKAICGPLAPIHCSKALFNTPSIHLSYTVLPFRSACLYTPTFLYDSLFPSTHPLLYPPFICPLTSVYTPVRAFMMEWTKPRIFGITFIDFLSFLTLFLSLHASFTLYSSFFSFTFLCITSVPLSILLPTSCFLSTSLYLPHCLPLTE